MFLLELYEINLKLSEDLITLIYSIDLTKQARYLNWLESTEKDGRFWHISTHLSDLPPSFIQYPSLV